MSKINLTTSMADKITAEIMAPKRSELPVLLSNFILADQTAALAILGLDRDSLQTLPPWASVEAKRDGAVVFRLMEFGSVKSSDGRHSESSQVLVLYADEMGYFHRTNGITEEEARSAYALAVKNGYIDSGKFPHVRSFVYPNHVAVSKEEALEILQAPVDAYYAFKNKMSEISDLTQRVQGKIRTFKTVGSLIANWPEVEPFVLKALSVEKGALASDADVRPDVSEINAALGLSTQTP